MGQGGKGPKKQWIRDAVRFPERSIPAAETGVSVGAKGGWAVPSQEGLAGTDGAEGTSDQGGWPRQSGAQPRLLQSPRTVPSFPATDPPHRGVSPFTVCVGSPSFSKSILPAPGGRGGHGSPARLGHLPHITQLLSRSRSLQGGPENTALACPHGLTVPDAQLTLLGHFKQIWNATAFGTEHRSEAGLPPRVLPHPAPPSSSRQSPCPQPPLLCVRIPRAPLHPCPLPQALD